MAEKTDGFTLRVPAELRKAIRWGARKEGKSQSDFMIDATLVMISQIQEGDVALLPEEFRIPTDDSKTVAIRVAPAAIEAVKEMAPRLYHSATRLILWASAVRAFELVDDNVDDNHEAKKKSAKKTKKRRKKPKQ